MISLISSFEIISVVIPDPTFSYELLHLLANGLSKFPIKVKPVFSNGPKSLPKNPPDCPI